MRASLLCIAVDGQPFLFGLSLHFQESPMPDPSELFTNVYVKGFGVEVDFISPCCCLF